MDPLVPFSLPISGMRDGMHRFRFEIGKEFFSSFEGTVIPDGNLIVTLEFDKRPSLFLLDFFIQGTVRVECDRCLEPFDLPLESRQMLMVKFDEEAHDEAEVVYILRGTTEFNVASYIYEFIHLAVPMIKNHEMAGQQCDENIHKYLQPGEPDDSENPIWQELKKLNKNL